MKMQNDHVKTGGAAAVAVQRLVRCHGHIIQKSLDVLGHLVERVTDMVDQYSQGFGQNACSLLGKSILDFQLASLVTPNCLWPQRTQHKNKNPAWLGGDTLAVSRLEYNHPENGGDASGHPPTPAQPPESSEWREYKDSMQLQSMQSRLQTITNIVWLILGLQIMKEVNPTMSLWLRLPIASALSSLLTSLLPICESRLLHLWRSDSCDARMTPNDPKLSHADGKDGSAPNGGAK